MVVFLACVCFVRFASSSSSLCALEAPFSLLLFYMYSRRCSALKNINKREKGEEEEHRS